MIAAKLAQYHLLQGAGSGIGLEREHAREDFPPRNDIADPQCRRDRFGERADVDHAFRLAHGVKRRRPMAIPNEVRVALILEDRDAMIARQPQQFHPTLFSMMVPVGFCTVGMV